MLLDAFSDRSGRRFGGYEERAEQPVDHLGTMAGRGGARLVLFYQSSRLPLPPAQEILASRLERRRQGPQIHPRRLGRWVARRGRRTVGHGPTVARDTESVKATDQPAPPAASAIRLRSRSLDRQQRARSRRRALAQPRHGTLR